MAYQAEPRNLVIFLKVGLFISLYSHATEHADNYRADKATKTLAIGKYTSYIRDQEQYYGKKDFKFRK